MSETGEQTRVRALLRLAREVTARHDLEDVLVETFRELRTVVTFGGGSIQLIDDDGWITVAACDPPAADDALQARVPLGNSVAGRVVLTEQAIYVSDVQRDGRALLPQGHDQTAAAPAVLYFGRGAVGRLKRDFE